MVRINTEYYSIRLREKVINPSEQKVLIACLSGSGQEKDLSAPVNCGGYGRIRHFRINKHDDWSLDPLPNLPAAKALGHPSGTVIRAQVFQLAACVWRCWYCFVDYDRLSANQRVSKYFSADEALREVAADIEEGADIVSEE